MKRIYCHKIGYEFAHLSDLTETKWLADKIEMGTYSEVDTNEMLRAQYLLTKSECFDQFMTKKFPQVKRYGLEGAESMLVALDTLFHFACASGIDSIVIGMPHRGRLNVLTSLLQFPLPLLFSKVQGHPEFPSSESHVCTGDVLSHLAHSVSLPYGSNASVRVSLLHNPSHLEAINPVVAGKTRAKQMLGLNALALQIHGDASFSGQGVVMETLLLAHLPHYTCAGSIHLVLNNQLGYTTPSYNARSTRYCTDLAKFIECPIFHVNGDHPEDVIRVMKLALDFRNTFHKDVVIDLVTYRKWGHNEVDEPSFTQPRMYEVIKKKSSIAVQYETELLEKRLLQKKNIDQQRQWHTKELEEGLNLVHTYVPPVAHLQGHWKDMISPKEDICTFPTGVTETSLKKVAQLSVQVPSGFQVHPRLDKYHVQARLQRIDKGSGLDWATAEALAFGTLLEEGYTIRLSGQDVGRGTFSQRHCMLVDQTHEQVCIPLNALGPGQLEVANSPLSEFGVMGFELGFSWESPKSLVLWEAQFGDFFNTAQVVIDTFLSSTESKWLRQSGLVLLLPHGYDGAGPEHSSCRLERFLQMASMESGVANMHVTYPTTPAQYFHLLRRQVCRPYRKPLVVVGPKMLLRLPAAVSSLSEMGPNTSFQPVLEDSITDLSLVQRLIFCSGKLYYELQKLRDQHQLPVAILRIEELAPFPTSYLIPLLQKYAHVRDYRWCQEEPMNQGAYLGIEKKLQPLIPTPLMYIGRDAAAAPATGVSSIHCKEQENLLNRALSIKT
ncbi:putative 2-oxoglutarate dehydrogenase E1 component DHKTD1, mitochondrial [Coelomomyces lativittatus]|nr:putative 2-oxoglutarate dehydrogenase E1 component DHKTD1, mitochondrial [Coelomomyces lativittatus]